MDLALAVQHVRDNFGFHRSLDETVIRRHLDRAKEKYEVENSAISMPNFLFDPTYEITTEGLTNIITMTPDFISLSEDWDIILRHKVGAVSEAYPLQRVTYDEVTATATLGRPTHYTSDSYRLYLFPMPDQAYRIQIPHYKKTPSFLTDDHNIWLDHFPFLIIWEATLSLSLPMRDNAARGRAQEELTELRTLYYRKVEAAKHQFQEYILNSE